MKKYVKPEAETIKYEVEDCLTSSGGEDNSYNIEFDLPDWKDDFI